MSVKYTVVRVGPNGWNTWKECEEYSEALLLAAKKQKEEIKKHGRCDYVVFKDEGNNELGDKVFDWAF